MMMMMKNAMNTLHILQLLLALQICQVSMSNGNNNDDDGGETTTNNPNSGLNATCMKQLNCSQCIQTLGCVWCKDTKLSSEPKCFADSRPIECANVENPQGGVQVEENAKGDEEKHVFQPQVVKLDLRKGEKKIVTVDYEDKKQRPLDLYIVMDMSCTMTEHKKKVADLALTLASNLKSLTNDLTIGFGSFVDKPLAPFGFLSESTKSNTPNTCGKTGLPYGFKNHLKLTNNITRFVNEVENAGITSNIDTPEGILDGLLQSIVCSKEIGWRSLKGNRRLVVVSTDGTYHLAGDGKLVGVVLPHDGNCYVDSNGLYTHSTILDYPSISVIRQKIRENEMFVIFAVTKDQQAIYEQLTNQLWPFATTQGIDGGSNSITKVIEDEYRKLVDTVQLMHRYSHPEYIDISFQVKCPGEDTYKSGNECNKVEFGKKVSYKIEVELKDCPSSSGPHRNLWQSNVTIYPLSSRDDGMTIKLNMLCGCGCELESGASNTTQTTSPECSDHGNIECGICHCEKNWGGPICNCSLEAGVNVDRHECANNETGEICSNRGKCDSCGKCNCFDVDGNRNAIGGKYCQCSNTDCEKAETDKGLCNQDAEDGSHGSCVCSRCECNGDYTGSRCECPTGKMSDKKCRDAVESPNSICNGLGKCQCGKCVCSAGYTGAYCQVQHAQVKGSCDMVKDITDRCVKCLVLQNEDINSDLKSDALKRESCKADCESKNIYVEFHDRIVGSLPDEESKNVCSGVREDANGCRIDFIVRARHIHNNTIFLDFESGQTIRREKCPVPAPFLLIGIGVASGMVLIGVLLLLAWKVVTHIHDRKEYARFEKSVNDPTWDIQSPLYISATSAFENPAYSNLQESQLSTN